MNNMQPQSSQPASHQKQAQPKKTKRAPLIIAIIVAIIAIIVACLLAFNMCSPSGSLRDPNQNLGQVAGKTQEEIEAELNRQVQDGMFNISIASYIEFADGQSEGDVSIENVPGNRYLMQVTVTDDNTGEVLYETGLIDPGYHVQKGKLAKDLDPGQYPATAVFTAYDLQTEEEKGKAAAKLTIDVLN